MPNTSASSSSRIRSIVRRVAVGTVTVGALSMGVLGLAGTAGAATTTPPKVGTHFSCDRADKVLTRITKGEAKISAGLPKLTAAEQKATADGHTKLAARLGKVITRLESPAFKTKLTNATTKIEAKCPGSAPSSSTSSS
jgi:hypothetical protein